MHDNDSLISNVEEAKQNYKGAESVTALLSEAPFRPWNITHRLPTVVWQLTCAASLQKLHCCKLPPLNFMPKTQPRQFHFSISPSAFSHTCLCEDVRRIESFQKIKPSGTPKSLIGYRYFTYDTWWTTQWCSFEADLPPASESSPLWASVPLQLPMLTLQGNHVKVATDSTSPCRSPRSPPSQHLAQGTTHTPFLNLFADI